MNRNALSLLQSFNCASLWNRKMRVWGRRVCVSSFDRYLYLGLHRWRLMGRQDRKALTSLVKSGMRVVDVGANIGLYTLLFSELVGDGGRVFAFEPEPQLCELLRQNCMINSVQNVRTFECALGSVSGRTVLWRSAFNSGDNRLNAFGWTESGVDVPLARLDDMLPGERIDFVKIDVQGHELAVLQGMEHVSRSNPHVRVYFEFTPSGLGQSVAQERQLIEYLAGERFHVFCPDKHGWIAMLDWHQLSHSLRGRKYVNLLATRDEKPVP